MEEKQDNEKKAQQMYLEFQMLDQHIKQLQRQLELVTQQLMELNVTSHSLEDLNKTQSGKEIFVPVSSGIFAKASLKDTSELLVNVGANVVVSKDIESTKKLISDQLEEVKKLHNNLVQELERMTNHAAQLEVQLQKLVSSQ